MFEMNSRKEILSGCCRDDSSTPTELRLGKNFKVMTSLSVLRI